MKKSFLIVGSIAVIATIAVVANFSTAGLEGRFAGRDEVKIPELERIVPESRDLAQSRYSDTYAYIPPEPKYVTMADLMTEIMYRKLNLTSGWGENKNKMPGLDLDKAPPPIMDCDAGLVDGKFELGEWQYCYLKVKSMNEGPFMYPSPVMLQEKITRSEAAFRIFRNFFHNPSQWSEMQTLANTYKPMYPDVNYVSGSIDAGYQSKVMDRAIVINALAGNGMFEVAGGKGLNFRPNDYLTEDEAKIWFKNLNTLTKGQELYNVWNYAGDFAKPQEAGSNIPKAY